MSVELSKIITEVPLKVHGAVGIGVGVPAGTTLILDVVSSWLMVAAAGLGIVVSALSIISLFYRIRQDKIRTERDQLELEMSRRQLQDMAQKAGEHK